MTDAPDRQSLGSAPKLLGLAGARMAAQGLGLGWFLVAARALDPHEFGVLSVGLVLVVVIGGLSDLGTTRTVVRHVAADPGSLRANYLRAVAVRAGAGLVATALAAVGALVLDTGIPVAVLVLASLIAVASGATEVGFAALRSVGSIGAELRLLVGERVLFLLVGSVTLLLGGGPVAVLAVYAATNLLSALVVGASAVAWPGGHQSPAGPVLDAEGRHTAVSSTLMILGPRVSALLLVLLAAPAVVGTFTIAQKVPEALGILGTAVLLPVLPLLRASVVARGEPAAVRHGSHVTAAVVATLLPVTVWLALDGDRVLDLLFDAGGRHQATLVLALLAAIVPLWIVRTFGELVLLARERADRYLVAVAAGVVLNIAAGIPAVEVWGAAGAAYAACAAEVVVLGLVLVAVGREVRSSLFARSLPVLGIGVGAALTLAVAVQLPLAVSVALTGDVVPARPDHVGSGPAGGLRDGGRRRRCWPAGPRGRRRRWH